MHAGGGGQLGAAVRRGGGAAGHAARVRVTLRQQRVVRRRPLQAEWRERPAHAHGRWARRVAPRIAVGRGLGGALVEGGGQRRRRGAARGGDGCRGRR